MAFLAAVVAALSAGNAYALPSLQLGPGDDDSWEYVGGGDDTWYVDEDAYTVMAYANAQEEDGGNGDYAFTGENTDQTAYIVFSAVPETMDSDAFSIEVMNDGVVLSPVQEGYGAPPDGATSDTKDCSGPDDLACHGVFDTYFYVYEFDYDGLLEEIYDTQPGEDGSGMGYSEAFNVAVTGTSEGLQGIHMDLFTVYGEADGDCNDGWKEKTCLRKYGDGQLDPSGDITNQVYAVAPYSHDGQWTVPEPGAIALMAVGLVVMGVAGRRRRIGVLRA